MHNVVNLTKENFEVVYCLDKQDYGLYLSVEIELFFLDLVCLTYGLIKSNIMNLPNNWQVKFALKNRYVTPHV